MTLLDTSDDESASVPPSLRRRQPHRPKPQESADAQHKRTLAQRERRELDRQTIASLATPDATERTVTGKLRVLVLTRYCYDMARSPDHHPHVVDFGRVTLEGHVLTIYVDGTEADVLARYELASPNAADKGIAEEIAMTALVEL